MNDSHTRRFDAAVASRGIRIVGQIQHPHGVKAVAAFMHLREAFPHWAPDFWEASLRNAQWFDEPVVDGPMQAPRMPLNERRAEALLHRAVLPIAYQATREWTRSAGTENVISHYLAQAAASPEYLGHRVSVLLAFLDAWPIYKDGPEAVLFLDRLTELILACKFSMPPPEVVPRWATYDEALSASSRRPGFFGHHLIVLAWTRRFESLLEGSQRDSILAWIVECSRTQYEDDEDNVDVSQVSDLSCDHVSLEYAIQRLLIAGKPNIHLITLADALVALWNVAGNVERSRLLATARRYTLDNPI
ncbi:MAG: hypothetical protein ABI607_04775 [Betaproteobacteria bacterium]